MKKDLTIFFSGFALAAVFFLIWEAFIGYFVITPQILTVCVLFGAYHWGMHLLMEKGKKYKIVAGILEMLPIVCGIFWLLFVAALELS